MHHFEIDVPSSQVAQFDRVLDRFVETELLLRPDINMKITRYSIDPGVERRGISLSSSDHMAVLLRQLQAVTG